MSNTFSKLAKLSPLLFTLCFSACSSTEPPLTTSGSTIFPQEQQEQINDVKITENIIPDTKLQTTAENLPSHFSELPQNTGTSTYQKLTKAELTTLINTGQNLDNLIEDSAFKINTDYFHILHHIDSENQETFQIFKNNELTHSFTSESFSNYSPLVSVRVIQNRYTVEYLKKSFNRDSKNFEEKKRIWQDGIGELTAQHHLQNAIFPFETSGKLTFLAEQENQWFLMADGERASPYFTRIDYGYCCEPAKYQPRAFNYRYYTFFATQDSQQKLIQIDLGEQKEQK